MSEVTPSDSSHSSTDREAWLALLGELEASLGAVALGTADLETNPAEMAWTPPLELGPIPADLVDRARDILQGQRELIGELHSARRAIGEQLAALRQVPSTQSTAVYLDITG